MGSPHLKNGLTAQSSVDLKMATVFYVQANSSSADLAPDSGRPTQPGPLVVSID